MDVPDVQNVGQCERGGGSGPIHLQKKHRRGLDFASISILPEPAATQNNIHVLKTV